MTHSNIIPIRRSVIDEAFAALRLLTLRHENEAERLEAIERALKAVEEAMCVPGGVL